MAFIFVNQLFAQDDLPCANEKFQQQQLNDPAYRREFDKVNNAIISGMNRPAAGNPVYVIPIAVHVLHLGEPIGTGSNISDQQIIDAVQGANERWRHVIGNSVDMEIEFCLAQYDPNGNPSTGIDRIDASSLPNYKDYGISYVGALGEPGSDELNTKNLLNWPHNYVFNIWVVHRIAGDWGGYAFFPFTFNYPTDGVVITANSTTYASTTLAHELGHGMGLFHTFQGDENGCPANDICFLQGDWVCDTPPHKKPDCGASTNCSNNPDSVLINTYKNYMSYCGGRDRFTPGQKERSRLAIKASTRVDLLRSYACSGPPCDTAFTQINTQTCDSLAPHIHYDTLLTSKGCDSIIKTINTLIPLPHADFSSIPIGPLLTAFHNNSQNAISYLWNFDDDSTSTEAEPVHQYLSEGSYNVSLVAQNSCGSDTANRNVVFFLTGIKTQNNSASLSIFPNPNNGSFKFDIDIKESCTIEIINALGQIIEQQILSAGKQHSISLHKNISKGIYQLRVKKNNGEILGETQFSIH